MSGPNISDFAQFAGFDISQLSPTQKAEVAKAFGFSSADSMTQAAFDQAIASYFLLFNMAFPALPPPSDEQGNNSVGPVGGTSATALIMAAKNRLLEIAIGVLDSWLDSLKKIADEYARKISSPEYRAELDRKSASAVAHEETKTNLVQGLIDGMSAYVADLKVNDSINSPSKDLAYLSGALIIGSQFVGNISGVADPDGRSSVAFNPQASFMDNTIWNPLRQTGLMIPTDTSFVANLFVTAAALTSAAEGAKQGAKGDPKDPQARAESFAKQITALVNSNGFISFLMSMQIHKNEKGEPLNNQQKTQNVETIKAVLLSLALTALYMAKKGGGTGAEFLNMLENGKGYEPGSTEESIVAQLRGALGGLSANAQQILKDSFVAFIDNGPQNPTKKFDGLFNVGNVFDHLTNGAISRGDVIQV